MPFHESGYLHDPREVHVVQPRVPRKVHDGEPHDCVYRAAPDFSPAAREALRAYLKQNPHMDLTMLLELSSDP